MRTPIAERFRAKFTKGRPDECWIWRGATGSGGYGQIRKGGNAPSVYAHRVAYELASGPIPEGMCVMHTCDTPPCVNHAHLRIGSHIENMADRDAKGRARAPRGERCATAKVTEQSVRDIRRRCANGELQVDLAREHGITQAAVSMIVKRKNWAHVE